MDNKKKESLIVIEGIDGSGKSTLVKGLQDSLHRYSCTTLYAPSDPSIISQIQDTDKNRWFRMLYLFMRDRELSWGKMEEALQKSDFLIQDRYYHSSCAYQGGILGPKGVLGAHGDFLHKPDITFVLDLPVDVAMERIKNRSKTSPKSTDLNGYETTHFLTGVRERYLEMCSGIEGFEDCVLIDADKPPEEVLASVRAHIPAKGTCLVRIRQVV